MQQNIHNRTTQEQHLLFIQGNNCFHVALQPGGFTGYNVDMYQVEFYFSFEQADDRYFELTGERLVT